ncbi:MAG: hypothetical protein SWO11_05640 [Thermodesulfobacteriota bacterium]|nr:hypothetical protein [Thermodesulfobacteriota bacterium]
MPNPGDMVQIDVKYVPYPMRGEQYNQFTGIDDFTIWCDADIYPEKSSLTDSSKNLPFLYAVSKRMEIRNLPIYMSQTLDASSKKPEYTCRIKYELSTLYVIKSFHHLHHKSMARLKEDNFSDLISLNTIGKDLMEVSICKLRY